MTKADKFEDYLKKRTFEIWADNNLWESPIEQKLGCALYAMAISDLSLPFICKGGSSTLEELESLVSATVKKDKQPLILMLTQQPIGNYRVDMLIMAKRTIRSEIIKIVVESDGHDFHEKTKQQASKDKKRDRELSKLGLRVLRFTGSEIHKNPFNCAIEALEHVMEWKNG